jgi:hypothetical protein
LTNPEDELIGKLENRLSVTENEAVGTAVIPELANDPVIGTLPAKLYCVIANPKLSARIFQIDTVFLFFISIGS